MGKNILLCGFMSCGKTTVGKKLAAFLDYKFMDTDDMIIESTGKSIKEIFNEGGEVRFRDIEHETAKKIQYLNDCVISTGGGLMTYQRNVDVIKNSIIVYINTDFEVCYNRLKGTGRPIVSSKTKQEKQSVEKEEKKTQQKTESQEITDSKKDITKKSFFLFKQNSFYSIFVLFYCNFAIFRQFFLQAVFLQVSENVSALLLVHHPCHN